jgi:hypothetical protein
MPKELPADESAELAEQLSRDLKGDSRNQVRSRAYAIIAEVETFAGERQEDWTTSELVAEMVNSLGGEYSDKFVGRTEKARKDRFKKALRPVVMAMCAIRDRDPLDICDLPEFLQRYGLQAQEYVPFRRGIKIVTGEDRSHHLNRARDKFNKLVESLRPPDPDPDNITVHRLPHPARAGIRDLRLIRFERLAEWRNREDEADDEWSFAADDLWRFWKVATQKKIRRTQKIV